MIRRQYKDIAAMVGGHSFVENHDGLWIQGVSIDSRTIKEGNLFFPFAGQQLDGHDYVQEVFAQGAAASLWQNDHPNPPEGVPLIFVDDMLKALQHLAKAYRNSLPVRVVGITGSNGKTTTKDMVASILATTYKVHKTEANMNTHIGLPLTLLQMDEDTEMAVLEMGMRGRGEIELLAVIAQPEVAIITNVGEAHLERLGSREEIARAKLEIVEGLQPGGLLVYQGDNPLINKVLSERNAADSMLRFTFGADPGNDLYPTAIMLDSESNGTHFTTNASNGIAYYIPLLGQHNVTNALAAIIVSKYMGVREPDITRGLQNLRITGMRVEIVRGANGLTIINDAFNASPTAMRAAISTLEELRGYGRKMIVLGDMLELGDEEQQFHREIGERLTPDQIDYVFTYGKLAEHIADAAQKKYPLDHVFAYQDKEELVRKVRALAKPADVVLVKASRGMKLDAVVEALKDAGLLD